MTDWPVGWANTEIEQLFAPLADERTLHQGWSPQCERVPADDGEWGVLKTTAIQPGSFHPEHNKRLPSKLDPRPQIEVHPGDLLITCAGPRARCGVSCLVRDTRSKLMMSGKMYRFRLPDEFVSPQYVEYYLQTEMAWLAIDRMKTGGSDSGLNLTHERFRHLPVPLAPRKEQERIVAAIEDDFSRIDAGAAALERVRLNLNRMRSAVLQASISGELIDPDPSSWRTVAVGELAEVTGGITKNPKRVPGANAIPFLRVANVPRDGLDLRDVHLIEVFDGELGRLRLRAGDLLVVEGNGSPDQIGRSALWRGSIDPCVHQNHLIRVRPGADVYPEFLNLYWNAPTTMAAIQAQASSTSGLHTLSTGKVRAIPVTLPSRQAQERIVEEASAQLELIRAASLALANLGVRVQGLRASILAAAFSGSLVPHDSNDEPAVDALQRIASERAAARSHNSTRIRKQRIKITA